MEVKEQQLECSDWERSRVQTRKEKFFCEEEMEAALPFSSLVKVMQPFLPASGTAGGKDALWVGDHATDSPDAELVVPERRRYGKSGKHQSAFTENCHSSLIARLLKSQDRARKGFPSVSP